MVLKIFYVHPENWGRWTHFDEHIFQTGWNHQLAEDFGPNQGFYTGNIDSMMLLICKICKLVSHDDPVPVSLSSYKRDDSKKKIHVGEAHKKRWFSLRNCLKDMHTIVFSSPWIVQRPFIQIRVNTRHTTERMQTMPFPLKFEEYPPRLAIFRRF